MATCRAKPQKRWGAWQTSGRETPPNTYLCRNFATEPERCAVPRCGTKPEGAMSADHWFRGSEVRVQLRFRQQRRHVLVSARLPPDSEL